MQRIVWHIYVCRMVPNLTIYLRSVRSVSVWCIYILLAVVCVSGSARLACCLRACHYMIARMKVEKLANNILRSSVTTR